MTRPVDISEAALRQLLAEGESRRYFAAIGREVRDRARVNARSVGSPPGNDPTGAQTDDPADAIVSVVGQDEAGLYVDVGYAKHHPGFYLWWWEVGTWTHEARPHLRPALQPLG